MNVKYIPSLDGIRAIAVFIVLVSHAGLDHIVPGGLGVTIFFFLSGFLITTLLNAEHDYAAGINFKKFYIRRFYRLFPPLIICLFLGYLLASLELIGGGVSFSGFFYQLFYLANYQIVYLWDGFTPEGTGLLWSLAIEEHFYIFYPLLLSLILKSRLKDKAALIIAFLCLLTLLWRIVLVAFFDVPSERTYYATDTRADSLLFGCLLALFFNPNKCTFERNIPIKVFAYIAVSTILMLASLIYRNDFFRETFRYSIQGVSLFIFFYSAVKYSRSFWFSWLEWTWVRKLGIYSYSIYLFHYMAIVFIKDQHIANHPFAVILLSSGVSIFIAYLIDTFVEGYFRKLRKKLH